MEKLLYFFDQSLNKINEIGEEHQGAKQKDLSQTIRKMRDQLIEELESSIRDNNFLNNVAEKFSELERILNEANFEASTTLIERIKSDIEQGAEYIEHVANEEEKDDNEKQSAIDVTFEEMQYNNEQRKSFYRNAENIDNIINAMYQEIQENSNNYVFNQRMKDDIEEIVKESSRICTEEMLYLYDSNIVELSARIETELGKLYEGVNYAIENKQQENNLYNKNPDDLGPIIDVEEKTKSDNAAQFMNPDEYREPNPNDLEPILDVDEKTKSNNLASWDLRGYGTTPEEVRRNTSKSIKDFNNGEPDENPKSLPDNVLE